MRVFVISLPTADERRRSISNQLVRFKIQFDFIDACWGKDFIGDPSCYDESKARKSEGRALSPGEVGCALSHSGVYRRMVEEGIASALILEDDVILSDELPEALTAIERDLVQGQIVILERCDVYRRSSRRPLIPGYAVATPRFVREGSIAQTAGYVISLEAARRIANVNRPVFFPADSWGYYLRHVDFKAIVPSMSLVRQDTRFESVIQQRKRTEFKPNTAFDLWFYGLRTYNPVGRWLFSRVKKIYKSIICR